MSWLVNALSQNECPTLESCAFIVGGEEFTLQYNPKCGDVGPWGPKTSRVDPRSEAILVARGAPYAWFIRMKARLFPFLLFKEVESPSATVRSSRMPRASMCSGAPRVTSATLRRAPVAVPSDLT